MRVKIIDLPIYFGKLACVLSDTTDGLNRFFSEKSIQGTGIYEDEENLFCHALHLNYKGRQAFVAFFNHKHPDAEITHSVIAHEALHLMSYIMKNRGIQYDSDNDEPQAYLLGFIVEFLTKELKAYGVEIK